MTVFPCKLWFIGLPLSFYRQAKTWILSKCTKRVSHLQPTSTRAHKHACKHNQFPARRSTISNWHKFLSWQSSDDFLCLMPWKCYKEVGRSHPLPFFPHHPVLWCLLFKEKNHYNKSPKPKHTCDMESSDVAILTSPSALSFFFLFASLHCSNIWFIS